jgi:hypothetical protein
MDFKLSESQISRLKQWQDKIKEIFGEYGLYDYTFTPNGIGSSVRVKSHITKTEINLTEIDKW